MGLGAFEATLRPIKELALSPDDYLGWDTEYNSETGKFICFQLWSPTASRLVDKKMTVDSLAKTARQMGVTGKVVYLVSFFSIAEMQFLPVVKDSYDWRLYGAGSLDASFYSEKWALELRCFDLARFFDKQSLAKVAESFGLEKLAFNRKKIHAGLLTQKKFREYAIHDARLCHEILTKLRESLRGADPLIYKTAPGCAAAVFRHEFLEEIIEPPEARERLTAMLGCWGGRSEALERGEFQHLWEYDLNSAYPNAAIALGELPKSDSWRTLHTRKSVCKNSIRGGFGRFRFRFPVGLEVPCLPVLSKGVLLYPLIGETFCTIEEIRLAYELGAEISIVECYGYTHGSQSLARYMDTILSERAGATGARKASLKLLANSLIGKLAQRVSGLDLEALRKLALEADVPIGELASLTIQEARALGIDTVARVGSVFYPEWNGLITGYVRAQISRAAWLHPTVYIATDAIWTKESIRGGPPTGFTLKRHGPGVVARTRLGYIVEDGGSVHIAHHGIWDRTTALELLSNDLDGTRYYTGERPNKLKESLRGGLHYGKWETYVRTASAQWDHKRELLPDGRTRPWKSAGDYEKAKNDAQRAKRNSRKIQRG